MTYNTSKDLRGRDSEARPRKTKKNGILVWQMQDKHRKIDGYMSLPRKTIGNSYICPVLDLQEICKILQALSHWACRAILIEIATQIYPGTLASYPYSYIIGS